MIKNWYLLGPSLASFRRKWRESKSDIGPDTRGKLRVSKRIKQHKRFNAVGVTTEGVFTHVVGQVSLCNCG